MNGGDTNGGGMNCNGRAETVEIPAASHPKA